MTIRNWLSEHQADKSIEKTDVGDKFRKLAALADQEEALKKQLKDVQAQYAKLKKQCL